MDYTDYTVAPQTSLKPALAALGLASPREQAAFVKLLQAAGAFGNQAGAPAILSDEQAQNVLAHVRFDKAEKSVLWLHDVTQETFLREAGKERWEAKEPEFAVRNREALLPLLEQTGMLAEAKPRSRHFRHALMMGGTEGAVDRRLQELAKLWNEGVRFDEIMLLGAARPTVEGKEPARAQGALTETQMMKQRFAAHSANWPKELRDVPARILDTPMKASGARPNTRDTFESWLAQKPAVGKVLVISDQPHVRYQQEVARRVLPKEFAIEAAGPGAEAQGVKISTVLDAFARQIDTGRERLTQRAQAMEKIMASLEKVTMVQPETLKVDAPRFQFRRNIDGNGVTQTHRRTGAYNPLTDGDLLLLWEDKSGARFVVDGHHRTELLQRQIRETGSGPREVPARILREADEVTADEARIIGAYRNFAQDRTVDLVDAARVFRDVERRAGELHAELLPDLPQTPELLAAQRAGTLSADAFALVEKGEVPVAMAAEVARSVSEPARQLRVMEIVRDKAAREAAESDKPAADAQSSALESPLPPGTRVEKVKIELGGGKSISFESLSPEGGPTLAEKILAQRGVSSSSRGA